MPLFSKSYMWIGIYLTAIILLLTLPINDKENIINNTYITRIRLDFILHGLLFIPWMSLSFLKSLSLCIKAWQWFAVGVLFAVGMELLQYFLSYRSFNVKDIAANFTGMLLGTLLYLCFKIRLGRP